LPINPAIPPRCQNFSSYLVAKYLAIPSRKPINPGNPFGCVKPRIILLILIKVRISKK